MGRRGIPVFETDGTYGYPVRQKSSDEPSIPVWVAADGVPAIPVFLAEDDSVACPVRVTSGTLGGSAETFTLLLEAGDAILLESGDALLGELVA